MLITKIMNSFGNTIMNPLFTGKEITELESVDSTNSYAIELLKSHRLAEGHIVWTKSQLRGRGQRGNVWESERGSNITLSVIWYPVFLLPARQFLLTQAVSLGVADFLGYKLEQAGAQKAIQIKWPNDMFVDDRKIAGILIENSLRTDAITSSVVGIGLNMNQKKFSFADDPISLALLTGQSYDIRTCILELCAFLEPRYLQLRAGKTQLLQEEYLSWLYRLNEWHYYKAGDHVFTGKVRGVSDAGRLLVETEDRKVNAFDFKEIVFV